MSNTVAIDRIARDDWPVSLATAKQHLRIEHDHEDDLIGTYLSAATDYAKGYTERTFHITKYRKFLDEWPRNPVCLTYPPFRAITGVFYIDPDGEEQLLPFDQVEARPYNLIGEVTLTGSMPAVKEGLQNIAIEYVAGYGDYAAPYQSGFPYTFPIIFGIIRTAPWDEPDLVAPLIFDSPETQEKISRLEIEKPIVQAILLLTAHFYENRENVALANLKEVPLTSNALLEQFRVYGV